MLTRCWTAHPTETLPWLSFCGPAELTGQAALCDYRLGRFRDAADRDIDALDLLPEGFGRNGFATQVSLAHNQLAAGSADEARATGDRALDLLPSVKSPRWARHLATFAQDVQNLSLAGGADFIERYEVVSS